MVGTKSSRRTSPVAQASKQSTRSARPRGRAQPYDLEAALAARPSDEGEKQPDVPPVVAAEEAAQLARVARLKLVELMRLPFDHRLVAALPGIVGAFREANGTWLELKQKGTPAALKKLRNEAELLKRDLLEALRYLLREDEAAQAAVDAIAEGDGLADLIDDLLALAKLAKRYQSALAPADLKGGPTVAAARATALANALSAGLGDERADTRAGKALRRRNQLFWLMQHAVSEIRGAARFALRHQPEELAAFRVGYKRRKAKQAAGGGEK